jgi:predicted DCC family thiol-disulfide oxidoreductase YuxK
VNTELTDTTEFFGWVLYDADCRFCVTMARRFRAPLVARHFQLLPLQTPGFRERLQIPSPDWMAEMRLLKPDGTVFGGADALLEISRQFRWTWPIRQLARFPGIRNAFHGIYRWVARHRHCASGACGMVAKQAHRPGWFLAYLPLLVFPLSVLPLRTRLEPWVFMWAMAFALYAGCKWMTYRLACQSLETKNPWRATGYLLAWPGMNASAFLERKSTPAKPRSAEWVFALIKTSLGFALLFGVTRILVPYHPIVAGWVGMWGAIFILHFGLFHLLSLAWRQAGVKAAPIMQFPLASNSLMEFWGSRWNAAFHELAFRFVYRPFRRLANPPVAVLGVFVLSGLIHDLVISLPARGGYGLPTLYFVIQGCGLVFERSTPGHRAGLGRGQRGRIFALVFTAGPAFWLFHPPFIRNVILPMLKAIGAT